MSGVTVDTQAPTVAITETGGTWSWACSESSCQYRSAVNAQPNHQFASESYGSASEVNSPTAVGTYYVHVQARDAAGNESQVANSAAFQVEDLVARVVSVSMPDDGVYGLGAFLDFTVTFNRAVQVTSGDPPYINITVGGLDRRASYQSVDGVNMLFRFVVPGSENGVVGGPSGSIIPNNAQIQDSVTNQLAVLTLAGVPDTSNIRVDTVRPSVSGIVGPENGVYSSGDLLFTVTMSEDVTVSGVPYYLLTLNGIVKQATYRSGASTARNLVFGYTIQAGDNDLDGPVVGTSIKLGSGGSIVDVAGNPSSLSLQLLNLGQVIVDTLPPTVAITETDGTWSWACSGSESCTYRHTIVVNTADTGSHTFADDVAYSATDTATPTGAGSYFIYVQGKDNAGHPSPVVRNGPLVAAPDPLEITMFPDINLSNQDSYSFSGTCTKNGTNITVGVYNGIGPVNPSSDISVSSSCTAAGTWSATLDVSSLGEGANVVYAAYSDGENLTTRSITKDTVPPVVTINVPGEVTTANAGNFPLSGTCSEVGETVIVTVGEIQPDPQATCQSGTPKTWNLSVDISALEGYLPVMASHTDAVGHKTEATGEVIVLVGDYSFLSETISGGGFHTCGVKSNQTVYCWGREENGALGNNESLSSHLEFYPVAVVAGDGSADNLSGIVQISAGQDHTCALTSGGQVRCWGGAGSSAVLGDNDTTLLSKSYPVAVVAGDGSADNLSGIVQISAGQDHTCALTSGGQVRCWGSNQLGQLADGTTIGKNYPLAVIAEKDSANNLSGIVQVSSGEKHSCALRHDGTVMCWGKGTDGQLGNGTTISKNYPVAVVRGAGDDRSLNGIVQVNSGQKHNCALKYDGTVMCWGEGDHGKLGYDSNNNVSRPVKVLEREINDPELDDIVQVSLGRSHSCARKQDGRVFCWGQHSSHEPLGVIDPFHSTQSHRKASHVKSGAGTDSALGNITQITAGNQYSCAQTLAGEMKCWGSGNDGRLGHGLNDDRAYPSTVAVDSSTLDSFNIGTYRRGYRCSASGCTLDAIGLDLEDGVSSPHQSDNAPSIAVSGIAAGKTFTLYSNSDCSTSVGSALTTDASVSASNLTEGTHRFYFTIADASDTSSCSRSFLAYIFDSTAPDAPALSLPEASGTDTTPDVSITGIVSGDVIKIYSDATCTTEAATSRRVDGVSGTLTVDAISGGPGGYQFYAKAMDAAGNLSACSGTSGVYTLESAR